MRPRDWSILGRWVTSVDAARQTRGFAAALGRSANPAAHLALMYAIVDEHRSAGNRYTIG